MNHAEDIPPPSSSPAPGRQTTRINKAGNRKEILLLRRIIPVFAVALGLVCFALSASAISETLLALFPSEVKAKASYRALTFPERVSYQRAIEEVYWRHRIWPKQRPDPKPSLDPEMSQAQLEKKVADYLRDSQVLENYWKKPISAEQLQAEMDPDGPGHKTARGPAGIV